MESKNIKKRTTFNVACYLKKSSVLKNGEVPIYMRITVNKQAVILACKEDGEHNTHSLYDTYTCRIVI